MTNSSVGAIGVLAQTALEALLAWLRSGPLSAGNGKQVPAIVSGLLMPLLQPRVTARLRGMGLAQRSPAQSQVERSGRASVVGETLTASDGLARRNAKLTQELSELRTAYAQLAHDAAAQSRALDRLAQLAYRDALTRLPNRLLLMDRLAQALVVAQRTGSGVLVMFLDLDNFKTINDTLGHAAGDRVLSEIAARIAGCLRASDTAGRVGGDEFVVVCPTRDAAGDAAQIQARLQAAIGAPIDINGTPVVTGACIGTSAFPTDGSDAAGLIARADRAMYCGKPSVRRR